MNESTPKMIASFGRRRGRKLSPRKESYKTEELPKWRLALPEGAVSEKTLLGKYKEIWLEIGFGGGEHAAEQARRNPDTLIIGSETFEEGVMKLVTEITEDKIENIRLWPEDARLLLEKLPDQCLSRVFILFPDPWPKLRHHKRRIINPQTLNLLYRVMKKGAELRLASDHADYVSWMLLHLQADSRFEWLAKAPEDFEREPEDWVKTRYQVKAEARGEVIVFLRYIRK